jgi:hypothetical protein
MRGILCHSRPSATLVVHAAAPVAQMDRAAGFEPVGRGFDSLRAHQSPRQLSNNKTGRRHTRRHRAHLRDEIEGLRIRPSTSDLIHYGFYTRAPVAQLDRALASEAKGRWFESCRAHHLQSSVFSLQSSVFSLQSSVFSLGPQSRRAVKSPRLSLISALNLRWYSACCGDVPESENRRQHAGQDEQPRRPGANRPQCER